MLCYSDYWRKTNDPSRTLSGINVMKYITVYCGTPIMSSEKKENMIRSLVESGREDKI